MTRSRIQHAIVRSAILAAIAAAGSVANAQFGQNVNTYDVSHHFTFTPAGDVAEVTGFEFRHAWVRSASMFGPVMLEEHVPDQQNPGFDPWGWDFIPGGQSGAMNSGLVSAVPVRYLSYNIPNTGTTPPGGGWPPPGCTYLEYAQGVGFTRALACNVIEVQPWVNQNPLLIQGKIQSYGYAWSSPQVTSSTAYAFSTSAIRVRGGNLLANGSIQWIPGFHGDTVGGSAFIDQPVRITDPIVITAVNTIDGDTVEHVLLDIKAAFGGDGQAEWNGNALTVDLPEFELLIDIPNAVVAPGQSGAMMVRIESGVVTNSAGTGLFAGVAPPLGLQTPLTIAMPDLSFDYDLGLNPSVPWDVTVSFSGGGDAETDLVGTGCPADINGDGLLNFFDVAEFISLFLEQHPAADFNGDGVIDFFDIASFLDAFMAGCPDPGGPTD